MGIKINNYKCNKIDKMIIKNALIEFYHENIKKGNNQNYKNSVKYLITIIKQEIKKYGNYNQKLTLNNLFTPIKEFKELKDSYIIKDKKDKNFGKDFRYIPIKDQ